MLYNTFFKFIEISLQLVLLFNNYRLNRSSDGCCLDKTPFTSSYGMFVRDRHEVGLIQLQISRMSDSYHSIIISSRASLPQPDLRTLAILPKGSANGSSHRPRLRKSLKLIDNISCFFDLRISDTFSLKSYPSPTCAPRIFSPARSIFFTTFFFRYTVMESFT